MSMAQPLYSAAILTALAQVLEPTAQAYPVDGYIEIHAGDNYFGRITTEGDDKWYSTTVQMYRDTRRDTWSNVEDTEGPFKTPSEAIRSLFGCQATPAVTVEQDVTAADQQSSFENATIQMAGGDIAFSVATTLDVPDYVSEKGEYATADYIRDMLGRAGAVVPGLSFQVQIGPNE